MMTHKFKNSASPLLQQSNGSPLTRYIFDKTYKTLLAQAGINYKKYTPHGLRRGGATFAVEIGMTPTWLKAQGDWRSRTWKLYYLHPVGITFERNNYIRNNFWHFQDEI